MKPRVGISSCLLGEAVRYDGGHKLDPFAAGPLGTLVDLVPVCPEVELGLGVPREPIRLERAGRAVRLVATSSRRDLTDAMTRFARDRADRLAALDLSGYVFKKNSPSCGPDGVPVAGSDRPGRGLFAAALQDRLPLLPVVDEGDLARDDARRHFLERVRAHRRLRDFFGARWTLGGLVRFHATEKLELMAHDPEGYRALGRLVARAKSIPRPDLEDRYPMRFMAAFGRPATLGRHVNVLEHAAGYFKNTPPARDLADLIRGYRQGERTLDDVRAIFRQRAVAAGVTYLESQTYLAPAAS